MCRFLKCFVTWLQSLVSKIVLSVKDLRAQINAKPWMIQPRKNYRLIQYTRKSLMRCYLSIPTRHPDCQHAHLSQFAEALHLLSIYSIIICCMRRGCSKISNKSIQQIRSMIINQCQQCQHTETASRANPIPSAKRHHQ